MSYVRLLRLPPQSGDIGPSCWRRHLSAGSSTEHARDAWHRRLRAGNYVLSKVGGDDILDAAAQRVLGKRCCEEAGIPWKGVAGGGGGGGKKNTTSAVSSTRPTSATLTAVGRRQINPAHRGEVLLCSTHSRESLPFWGALGTGWNHGVGGTGLQWQSLRAFASAPPEPASKTDSPNSKAARPGPRQRAFLGDLLKPSDVSSGQARVLLR